MLAKGPFSEDQRRRRLSEAGFNIRNLDGADVDYDLLSDVPPVSTLRYSESDSEAREPREAAAGLIYGEARFVETTHGRAAEFALAKAIAERRQREGGFVVLTHGPFVTTERAFKTHGARLEMIPRAANAGTSDVDLNALAERFRASPVDVVCLEPSNNSLGGWPLHLENVRAVSELCRANGALLILDATRLLSNAAALGGALLETAREVAACADAFTTSCGKELLVASGGLAVVRELALQRRIFEIAFQHGLLMEPVRARRELERGMSLVAGEPELFLRRKTHLSTLAELLRGFEVPLLEPIGAHAVCVRASSLMRAGDKYAEQAIESLLYRFCGVRAKFGHFPLLEAHLIRLTWPVGLEVTDRDLATIAGGVRRIFETIDQAPSLTKVEPGEHLHPIRARYVAAADGRW